jgi:hypothetical protein
LADIIRYVTGIFYIWSLMGAGRNDKVVFGRVGVFCSPDVS